MPRTVARGKSLEVRQTGVSLIAVHVAGCCESVGAVRGWATWWAESKSGESWTPVSWAPSPSRGLRGRSAVDSVRWTPERWTPERWTPSQQCEADSESPTAVARHAAPAPHGLPAVLDRKRCRRWRWNAQQVQGDRAAHHPSSELGAAVERWQTDESDAVGVAQLSV
jgi:hypothetical protein